MRLLPLALILAACSGHKDAPTDSSSGDSTVNVTDSGDSTVDSGDSAVTNPCGDLVAPPLSTTEWSVTGDVPGAGVLTFAQGPGGIPLYAGSHNSGLWYSDDQGETWLRRNVMVTHTLSDMVVSPDDPDVVYRSSGGILQRSSDGGQTWVTEPLGYVNSSGYSSVYALAVAPYDANIVYGVTDNGQSSVSTDAGDTFTAMGQLSVELSMGSMDPFNTHAWHLLPDTAPGGRIVFTDGSTLWTSDDGMATWQSRFASTVGGHSLTRDPTNKDHLMVGATDGLLESFDEGATWTKRDDVGIALELGAWAEDGSWLAYASSNTLYVSDDDGVTFTAWPFDWIENDALAIIGDRIIMSWDDGVTVSDDRGQTWHDSSVGMVDPGMSITTTDPVCPNHVFVGSRCSGGLYESEDWGTTWTHVDHYFHYVMGVHYDPNDTNTVWAVSDDTVQVSHDNGASWTIPWTKYHFHGFAVDPDDSSTILMGSVGSGDWSDSAMHVYKSTDGGLNWANSSSGIPSSEASAHTIVYWPGDTSVVMLGTYKGEDPSHFSGDGIGAFRSADGGATWTAAAIPEINIAFMCASPDSIFAATGNGLYRSKDKGVTWSPVSGPYGFMLSVDFKGSLGLTLSQDGRVWRTDDGGDTWTELDSGLASNNTSFLAQIAISEDSAYAWATVFDQGVYRIALR